LLLKDDYIDPDVAYLLGMILARGILLERPRTYEIVIEFPYQNLNIEVSDVDGESLSFDVPQNIELGLSRIRERLLDLLGCDISINRKDNAVDLILTFTRRTMSWRTILLHLDNKINHRNMDVPAVMFDESVTTDVRLEFIRGYADVAGNIRRANRYADGRNRVRLDVLNDNWRLPVQLCRLLQLYLDVPVQNIIWGHPNLNRGFREHQINIFVTPFEKIGFSFEHKQQVLNHFIEQDNAKRGVYRPCPGRRRLRGHKPSDSDEQSERLPPEARQHFDSYWQICKAMGCIVEPSSGPMLADVEEDVEEA
jgi:hypothetical protein